MAELEAYVAAGMQRNFGKTELYHAALMYNVEFYLEHQGDVSAIPVGKQTVLDPELQAILHRAFSKAQVRVTQ